MANTAPALRFFISSRPVGLTIPDIQLPEAGQTFEIIVNNGLSDNKTLTNHLIKVLTSLPNAINAIFIVS